MNVNTTTLIEQFTTLARMERDAVAKRQVLLAREMEAAAATAQNDWTRSVMRGRLATAQADLDAALAAMDAATPDCPSEGLMWICRHLARGILQKEDLEAAVGVAQAALEEATKRAEGDAWKWKSRRDGPTEPPYLVAARAAVTVAEAAVVAHEESLAPHRALVASYNRIQERAANLPPLRVETVDIDGLERLEWSSQAGDAEPDQGLDYVDEGEWGAPRTPQEILDELIPPPVPEEEAGLTVSVLPPTEAGLRRGRMLDAKRAVLAARRAARRV